MKHNIISTGSKGNAVIINDYILIDCGVPFRDLQPYYKDFKIVFLTHIHGDHFRKSTIKKLAFERPTLRFACCSWLVESLCGCDVSKKNIDVLDVMSEHNTLYSYGLFSVIPFFLKHNVPNCGYKIHFANGEKLFYATDCNNLNGIRAKNYDLYMVEANYVDEEIQEKIKKKRVDGVYAYETQVLQNHLSKAKCDDFIYRNAGAKSQHIYLHCHTDDEGTEQNQGQH